MCFTRCKCGWCRQTSFANSPDFPCLSCGNKMFATVQSGTMVAHHLESTLNIPRCVIRSTVEFLYWHDPDADFRRQYLLNVLLAVGSGFRSLTYFHSGIHSNISQCEDIIDRVVLFVVGNSNDIVVSRLAGSIRSNAAWFSVLHNCYTLAPVFLLR